MIRHGAFVDTSAIVGFVMDRDERHEAASREFDRLAAEGRRLVSSTDVFDETVTRLRRTGGHALAVSVGGILLRSTLVEMFPVTDGDRSEAWALFRRYEDHGLSFTDCTSIAVSRAHGLTHIVSFDAGFDGLGFVRLPPPA